MGSEGSGKRINWLPELITGVIAALVVWLMDKLQVFERLAPPIATFLSAERTITTWILLILGILILLLIIFSLRLALAYVALARSFDADREAPPPQAAPTPPPPQYSLAERRVLELLRVAPDHMTADEIRRGIVTPGGLTGPQVSAALESVRRAGLADFTLSMEFDSTYSLTQRGFDIADRLAGPGD